MDEHFKELMDTVVKNDYCIGCGICASLPNSPLSMKMNEDGRYKPVIDKNLKEEGLKINPLTVCPFSKNNNKETEIGEKIFGRENRIRFNEYLGYYIKSYAGYVSEGSYRKNGSSGGMGNWIASQLLKHNLVDGVIHVKDAKDKDKLLFEYQISNNINELLQGSKSKYYPIELSQVLKIVKENVGRYALVGIPCFIKGVRLLAEQDEIIKDRIKFTIGLVCGHLKSDMFAKSMGWQLGIEPDALESIDFRKKLSGQPANNYAIEVKGRKDGIKSKLSSPTRDLYTTNWGHGFFKYNACEFCDDIMAETADVTVGDAWLPEYKKDSMGTNIIVARNPIIQRILDENIDKKIYIEEISSEKAYESQAGGFRHRREGLSHRLYLKDKKNEWRPNKRVEPASRISLKRQKIYEKRTLLSKESFNAYKVAIEKKDFGTFINYMDPLIKEYYKITAPPFAIKALRKVKRGILKIVRNE